MREWAHLSHSLPHGRRGLGHCVAAQVDGTVRHSTAVAWSLGGQKYIGSEVFSMNKAGSVSVCSTVVLSLRCRSCAAKYSRGDDRARCLKR